MANINISKPILIKFTSLEFAKSFRKGTIYMNTMEYFRGIESDQYLRGDLLEGTNSIIAKDDFGEVLPELGMSFSKNMKDAIIGGMPLISEELKHYNIFSMYHLNCDFSTEYIEPIDSRINEFGDTFVLIFDFEEFQRRILFELNKENDECKYNILNFGGGKVEYYDWGFPTQKLGPLKKLKMYSYQKEYRLIAEPIEFTLEPLILNIGDISDISIIGLTKRLIEEIHFNKDKQIVVSGYNF